MVELRQRNKVSGFTLVELAIVIVVIGLITGGILQGQELIEQSRMRALMKSVGEYEAAALTFKDKYKFVPGDHPNATGLISSTLYNGNGNGFINVHAPTGGQSEMLYAWQQLAFTKLIKGSYTGLASLTGPYYAHADVNAPRVQGYDFGSVLMLFFEWSGFTTTTGTASNPDYFGRKGGHGIVMGNAQLGFPYSGLVSSAMAYYFDLKTDDGSPLLGKVVVANGVDGAGAQTGCINPTTTYFAGPYAGSAFSMSATQRHCVLLRWTEL